MSKRLDREPSSHAGWRIFFAGLSALSPFAGVLTDKGIHLNGSSHPSPELTIGPAHFSDFPSMITAFQHLEQQLLSKGMQISHQLLPTYQQPHTERLQATGKDILIERSINRGQQRGNDHSSNKDSVAVKIARNDGGRFSIDIRPSPQSKQRARFTFSAKPPEGIPLFKVPADQSPAELLVGDNVRLLNFEIDLNVLNLNLANGNGFQYNPHGPTYYVTTTVGHTQVAYEVQNPNHQVESATLQPSRLEMVTNSLQQHLREWLNMDGNQKGYKLLREGLRLWEAVDPYVSSTPEVIVERVAEHLGYDPEKINGGLSEIMALETARLQAQGEKPERAIAQAIAMAARVIKDKDGVVRLIRLDENGIHDNPATKLQVMAAIAKLPPELLAGFVKQKLANIFNQDDPFDWGGNSGEAGSPTGPVSSETAEQERIQATVEAIANSQIKDPENYDLAMLAPAIQVPPDRILLYLEGAQLILDSAGQVVGIALPTGLMAIAVVGTIFGTVQDVSEDNYGLTPQDVARLRGEGWTKAFFVEDEQIVAENGQIIAQIVDADAAQNAAEGDKVSEDNSGQSSDNSQVPDPTVSAENDDSQHEEIFFPGDTDIRGDKVIRWEDNRALMQEAEGEQLWAVVDPATGKISHWERWTSPSDAPVVLGAYKAMAEASGTDPSIFRMEEDNIVITPDFGPNFWARHAKNGWVGYEEELAQAQRIHMRMFENGWVDLDPRVDAIYIFEGKVVLGDMGIVVPIQTARAWLKDDWLRGTMPEKSLKNWDNFLDLYLRPQLRRDLRAFLEEGMEIKIDLAAERLNQEPDEEFDPYDLPTP